MRGFLIFLGLLLILGGGVVAGAQYAEQYANLDLSALSAIAGAKDVLLSPMALYVGGGAAAFGLLLIIIAAATGGKKQTPAKTAQPKTASAKASQTRQAAAPVTPLTADSLFEPEPELVVSLAPQPAVARSDEPPWSQPAPAISAKPTASAQPPGNYAASTERSDPRLHNRKRVTDLVTINDALKAYYLQRGAYPKAEGLLGFAERGSDWIPALAPDFIPRLPQDPLCVPGQAGPQYVYASDGKNYKLLAQGVSLIGGTNVGVLGVRIDPTRQPTAENAAFGFWTPEFASA